MTLGRCGVLERAAGGIELCFGYQHLAREGEEVGSYDGHGPGAGWMEVDEGGAYLSSNSRAVGEEENFVRCT